MYTLFWDPGAAGMAPHAVLEEIGAPHKLVLVDIAKVEHRKPEYLKVNPHGRIPAFVEEMLRLHTPLMQVLRVVKQPVELAGVALEPGDHVVSCWGRPTPILPSSATTPVRPTSAGSTTATSPSGRGRTGASVRTWPA